MIQEAYETLEIGGLRASIYQDEYAPNPRTEWDNFGHMVYSHPRYILGDEEMGAEEIIALTEDPQVIYLPLYIYDHSGVTMNTRGFSCPWDSGQVGIIYVTKEEIRKEYGKKRLSKKTLAKVYDLLRAEVSTLDQYLKGEVFGYVIERPCTCDHGEEHLDHIDSCWGFYGWDYVIQEAKSMAEYFAKNAA